MEARWDNRILPEPFAIEESIWLVDILSLSPFSFCYVQSQFEKQQLMSNGWTYVIVPIQEELILEWFQITFNINCGRVKKKKKKKKRPEKIKENAH